MHADFLTISKFTLDQARVFLESIRWGENGAVCPHRGCTTAYKITPQQGPSTRKGEKK